MNNITANFLIVQDIYEATKFHPLNLSNVEAGTNDKIYLCKINFSIRQISATLHSLYECLSFYIAIQNNF